MTYDTMTRDDLIATLRSRDAEIERLSLDLHNARNEIQRLWAQQEAIGAGGVDRRLHSSSMPTDCFQCGRPWHAGDCVNVAPVAAQAQPDAGLDVEAVLRRALTGDGFIAECDIPHIVAALTAQPAINGYTCTVPDDCETLHWRGQILSMNELASVAQPAASVEPIGYTVAYPGTEPVHVTQVFKSAERAQEFINNVAAAAKVGRDRLVLVPLYAAPVAAQPQPSGTGKLADPAPWCREDPAERRMYDAFRVVHRNSVAPVSTDAAWDAWQYRAALAAQPSGQAQQDAEDAARLDWLDAKNEPSKMGWRVAIAPSGSVHVGPVIQLGGKITSIREAIDAARKGEGGEK